MRCACRSKSPRAEAAAPLARGLAPAALWQPEPDPGYLLFPAQFREQRTRAINLRQRLADDRRVHGHRAVLLGVEPVRAGDRVDIAVEHQPHDLTLCVDERAPR